MKQDHTSKTFKVGDICAPNYAMEPLPGNDAWRTIILTKRIQSFQSGAYWEVLRADGTRSVIKEDLLAKVSLTSVK